MSSASPAPPQEQQYAASPSRNVTGDPQQRQRYQPSPSAREQQREGERRSAATSPQQPNTVLPSGDPSPTGLEHQQPAVQNNNTNTNNNGQNPRPQPRAADAVPHPAQPLAANANHQETILQRVCEIFKTAFGRDEALCRAEGRKYWLTRIIGHGATGIVLNAKAIATGQSFAVKIVEVASMSTSDKERAMAEVHSLLTCKFFSILKCHDDYVQYAITNPTNNNDPDNEGATDADRRRKDQMLIVSSSSNPHPHLTNGLLNKEPMMLALVVDLANAGDLRQEIKNRARRGKPFKEHEVGLLFIQILMAVHHVHCHHMIHRDIKTANVFLCSNGLVKLGDFGFSKQYRETVSTDVGRTFCGTPYYVAPEIWKRRPYSKKADMFSLGVLLYETLALKRPFEGATMSEVMEKTLAGTYEELPSTTSPEMKRIVRDLLSTDPARRPSSGQLLQYPLSKLFMDALVSIVQSHGQATFDEATRAEVNKNVAETRLTLKNPKSFAHAVSHATLMSSTDASRSVGGLTTGTTANQVIVNNMTLDNNSIYHEGMVHKLSGDGQWKRRYLCIFRVPNPQYRPDEGAGGGDAGANGASDPNALFNGRWEYKLLIAITKETIRQQCIIAPCHEFEDVFPVPPRYAGSNAENVFSLVYRTGAKRLAFQAANAADQASWMDKIQIALGIEEEEESSVVEIPV